MPYKDKKRQRQAQRESEARTGRRTISISLDKETAASFDAIALDAGGKCAAMRELVKRWSAGHE